MRARNSGALLAMTRSLKATEFTGQRNGQYQSNGMLFSTMRILTRMRLPLFPVNCLRGRRRKSSKFPRTIPSAILAKISLKSKLKHLLTPKLKIRYRSHQRQKFLILFHQIPLRLLMMNHSLAVVIELRKSHKGLTPGCTTHYHLSRNAAYLADPSD